MKSLLIVGNKGGTNIGGSLLKAAEGARFSAWLIEMSKAMDAPILIRRLNWWLRGRRPTWLGTFSKEVLQYASKFRPNVLLATGTVPIKKQTLIEVGQLGITRLNFLTDDPWNPAHHAPWFLETLPIYDHIFSPRLGNLNDLRRAGCRGVSYLPFGYDNSLFYPEPPCTQEEKRSFYSDVMFAGGADRDRVSYFEALQAAGFSVALYGDYWDRYSQTRKIWRGYADPGVLRKAIGGAKVALVLVRRANRDGNSMRTFEVPAVGACMLVEETDEHREIFGDDNESVVYFCNIADAIAKLRWLLAHEQERRRLAVAAHHKIVQGANTYQNRLVAMLNSAPAAHTYIV